jgi:GntR family transcriptional repressor for pyruvate dehydrogenase complex
VSENQVGIVRRRTLTGEVADILCRRIREQRLAAGAFLGTETELLKEFGVSRTVLREAINQLRGLGVVSSRQKLGLCVANGDFFDTLSKALAPLTASAESWPEICHLRFVLEVGSVPLAVERATPEQIERMRQLADEMLSMFKQHSATGKLEPLRIAEREIEFHQLVLDAAGGEYASRFHQLLVEYFHAAYGQGPHSGPPNLKDMQDHVRLVKAFAERNPGKAVAILVDHIRPMLTP